VTDRAFSFRFALYALLALALSAAVALPMARSNAHNRAVAQLEDQSRTIASILGPNLRPGQLDRPLAAPARRQLDLSLRNAELLLVKIVNRKGTVVWGSRSALTADQATFDGQVRAALRGQTVEERVDLLAPGKPPFDTIVAATPVVVGGQVQGALVVYHSWQPFASQIRDDAVIRAGTIGLALLLAYAALIPILRRLLRERRVAEERLRAREQLSHAIVEHVSQGIWVLGADGLIEFVNPKVEALLGYTAAEMIGRPIADFALAAPAERGREELLLRRSDGTFVWTLVATESLGEGGTAVGTIVDIEDLKDTEESLDGARRRLAAIVHAQREIAELETDEDAALQAVVERTRALTDADVSYIYFQEGDELVIRATSDPEVVPADDRIPLDGSLSGLALTTGAAQTTGDSRGDERVAPHWSGGSQQTRSAVLVPLSRQGTGVPAVLGVMRAQRNAFDDEAIETTRLMAEFAAVALRNAADARKRQELLTAVAEGEERFRNAIESSPIGFALCTPDDRYLIVNDSYCKLVGRSREELQPLTWRDLTHPDDLVEEQEPALRLVAGAVPHLELEKRLIHRDGGDVWVRMHISMVRDERGEPLYGLAQVQDITEHRRLETAVRERERLFRGVFEQSLLAKLLHDVDGTIVDANDRAAELTGIARTDLIGRHFAEFSPDPSRLESYWAQMLEAGWAEGESAITTRAGSRQVIFSARADVQPGRHLVTVQDVTEQRRLEERLRQGQKLEAVGRLAGGVAHDFNNLLTAISGYAQLLLGRPELDVDVKSYADEIEQAAQRAATLTRQLLAFSRRQVLQPTLLDVNAVVGGMQDMVTRLIGEHVRLELVLADTAAPVLADESQLEQVVVNLAVNAREAMPQGGVLRVETATIVVSPDPAEPVPAGRYTTLTISDTGVGMTTEQLERLFEPFYSTKGEAGLGLGLATAHGIVHQSGGHITVWSEHGRGANFRIWLPASAAGALPHAVGREEPATAAGTGTVLLVEDEPAVRAVVAEMLAGSGYSVMAAADGAEALRLSSAHDGEIHLLVTDVVMPGMSGQEVARRIGEARPLTRTLFVSGYNEEAIQQHGVLAPGTAFLEKPFSASDLARKAREVLDGASVG
jgi:two-component system cell cycle sensor histidine kinase/response regulator CckA